MSLLEDIKEWYKEQSYPPEGGDLDQEFVDGKWIDKDTETEQVHRRTMDSGLRWGNSIEVVYRRGDEHVAVHDVEPATEMQSWGDYGDPEIFPVEPYEVTVTKYRRID